MDEKRIATETLLRLRGQLSELRKGIVDAAKDDQFKDMPAVTGATILGVEMCLKMLDANLAVATGNFDDVKRFLSGEDDAIGDGNYGVE